MRANGHAINIDTLIARQRSGFALEQPFYRDPGIFMRDMEKVVTKSWLYVAHEGEIPSRGDYLLYRIGEESIILIRGRDEKIRAFFNVCRHRGSHICLEESGNVSTLKCPYHAWTYDLDGRLIAARSMHDDFNKADYPLHSCSVRVAHGLVFICLAGADHPDVADFDDLSGELATYAGPHDLRNTRLVHREIYPTHANWKLVVDNFRECYHCSSAHPEYTMVNAYVKAHDRATEGYEPVIETWAEKMRKLGHPVARSSEGDVGDPRQPHSVWRQPIREGYATLSEDGRPVAPLLGALKHWDGGETAFSFGPLSYAYLCADHLTMFRFTPVTPEFSEVVVTWHVRADAVEGKDFDLERLKWMWDVTTIEDTKIIINNQKGVNSAHYVPGPYALQESYSSAFTDWYLERIAS